MNNTNTDNTREAEISRIADLVIEKLVDNYSLRRDAYGGVYFEIYTDYRDELREDAIKDFFNANDPREAMSDYMWEWEVRCQDDSRGQLYDDAKDALDELIEEDGSIGELSEDDYDWVLEMVLDEPYYEFDRDFAQQDVDVNLVVDVGEANRDYGIMKPEDLSRYETIDEYVEENSDEGWYWLARQQGYTEEPVRKALLDGEFGGSVFLKSLNQEFYELTTGMAALTFTVRMTIAEAFTLNEVIEKGRKENHYYPELRTDRGTVTIPKTCTVGLVNPWSGSGSIIDISLEKDVVLPIQYLSSALPDGCAGNYGIKEIYGVDGSLWDTDCYILNPEGGE